MDKREIQSEMSSYIGRLLRENFGKGPAAVFVSIEGPYVTIYLKDFLAPMERVLVNQNNTKKVEETRDHLMKELIPEIKATWKATTGVDIESIYYDWSLMNRSGMLVAVLNTEDQVEESSTEYAQKNKVEEEVKIISKKAEKVPEIVNSFMLNDRTLIVKREGILVPIEKELIEFGNSEALRITKRHLEKRLLHHSSFEDILNVAIEDTFVDWDFHLDHSYIVFILKPKTS